MNKQTLPATAHFTREQYEAIEALSFTGLKQLFTRPLPAMEGDTIRGDESPYNR